MPLKALWVLFHLHTTYLAWGKGFWTAVLTLSLPGFAEVYWVIKLWNENPTYVNMFIILVVASIVKFYLYLTEEL